MSIEAPLEPASRQERAKLAVRLVSVGDDTGTIWTVPEVAAHFGRSPKTVYAWLTDVDGSKARIRKRRYQGHCPSCHAPTSPTPAGEPGRLCVCCAHPPEWTRDAIVAVLRDARQQLGRVPTSTDFHRGHATRRGGAALELFEHYGLDQSTVKRIFGSWAAAAAEAASFERGETAAASAGVATYRADGSAV